MTIINSGIKIHLKNLNFLFFEILVLREIVLNSIRDELLFPLLLCVKIKDVMRMRRDAKKAQRKEEKN